jgi:hypothetical protein
LLASDPENDPVWIVEGEKDADRLAAEGFIATTNHQGANSTHQTWPRFVEHFRDREVTIVPDHDKSGRNHAVAVAGYLHGVARLVRVVELPGLGPRRDRHGLDVSDWLDLGHTVEELGHLAATTPAWEPGPADAEEPAAGPTDATLADVRRVVAATAWLWPLWVPNAALTVLAAEPGTGKTRFCFDLHRRIYHGLPWPDGSPMEVPPGGRLLWIPADNHYLDLCELAREHGLPDEAIVLNAPAADPFEGTSLQTAEELDDLEARIARVNPVMVVIDTITNTADFKSQDSSDAKRQYKPLQEIAVRQRVPIICVTHLNAGGRVLGRRAVEKARSVIQLDWPDPDGQPTRRKLRVSKSKAILPPPLGVTMHDGGNDYDAHPPEAPDAGPARSGPAPARQKECQDWLGSQLNGHPVRVSHLRRAAEEAGFSAPLLYRAKDALRLEELEIEGKKWWRFTTDPEDEDLAF